MAYKSNLIISVIYYSNNWKLRAVYVVYGTVREKKDRTFQGFTNNSSSMGSIVIISGCLFFFFKILLYVDRWLTTQSNFIKISIFPYFLLGGSNLFSKIKSKKTKRIFFLCSYFIILDTYFIRKVKRSKKIILKNRVMS